MRAIPALCLAGAAGLLMTACSGGGGSRPASTTTAAPSEMPATANSPIAAYGLPGFAVFEHKGKLLLFRTYQKEYHEMLKGHAPGKMQYRIGEGPDGKTIGALIESTIDDYFKAGGKTLSAKAG